ncbi:MAG: hypothetical protein HY847_09405 [Betaproteobacteria bacterium]|nr:hypothetical protein [Betaproteobacteria bacterium]
MARKIVVTNSCQTAGISTCLQLIFPRDKIVSAQFPRVENEESLSRFAEILRGASHWVTEGHWDILEKYPTTEVFQVIKLPPIYFAGFHPDVVTPEPVNGQVFGVIDEGLLAGVWGANSALTLWGWKNGLTVDSTIKLFNVRNFYALGYVDLWHDNVNALREIYLACDINFDTLFNRWRRGGIFMHTHSHPKISALCSVAKVVSMKLGKAADVMELPLENLVSDQLTGWVWPVYPDIADALSVRGSYMWKISNKIFPTLDSYVRYAFRSYEKLGIKRSEVKCERIDSPYFQDVMESRA